MTDKEDISRIAKILARSTSSEPHEADTALRAAYKRMRRDHVDMRQLLTLPLEELYQESLTKLVTLILDEQPELSPAERRKAFQNYMALINARFTVGSASSTGRDSADEVHRARQKRNEEDARKAADHKARSEADIRRRREEFRQREQAFREREEALRQREHEMHSSQQQAPPPPFGSTREQAAGAASGFGAQAHAPHPDKNTRSGDRPRQTAAAPNETSSGWGGIVGFLLFCVFVTAVVLYQKKDFQTGWRTPPAAASAAPGGAPTSPSAMPLHAVAAPRVNLRTKATVSSKIKAVLKRGDAVQVQAMHGAFLQVKLSDGQVGFISRELVISWSDFERLQQTSAQDYIALRAPEKRVQLLFEQTEKHKDAFLGALHSLSNGGASIAGHLKKMQGVPQFNVAADAAASTWFSLSASAARSAGAHGQALLEALAAIEADPTKPQHHVAFAWDNYRAERYEVVRSIGKFLPKIAPTSSDAWLLFGFANGLTPQSDDVLTQSAFVLALQLSKTPEATRKYFRELTLSPYHRHIRYLLNAALADDRARPGLFDNIQRL